MWTHDRTDVGYWRCYCCNRRLEWNYCSRCAQFIVDELWF